MANAIAVYKEALQDRSLMSRFTHGRTDKQMRFAAQRSFALQIIGGSEKLRNCTPESIGTALLDVAYSGLTLSPSQQLLYLIPYKNECQLMIGYRGLEQLAYRTGVVTLIQSALVCKNDPVFRVGTGERGRYVMHEEAREERGDVTHAYTLAKFANGEQHVEVMSREDLDACQAAATKKNPRGGSVWRSKFRGEMQKKACVRRAWKHWPQDTDGRLEQSMRIMDDLEPNTFEGEAVRLVTERQVSQLTDACNEYEIPTDTVCRSFGIATLAMLPLKEFENAMRLVSPV